MYVGGTNKPVGMPKPDGCNKPDSPPELKPIMVDGFLSTTSTNPVQNKVISAAIKNLKKLTKATIDESLKKYNDNIINSIDSLIIDRVNKELSEGSIKDKIESLENNINNNINNNITNINTSIEDINKKITELEDKINSGGGGDNPINPPPTSDLTATLTAEPPGGTYSIGDELNPVLTWTSSKIPTQVTLTDCEVSDFDLMNKYGRYEVGPIRSNKNYTLKVSDGIKTITKSISYKFVSNYYYGVSDTNDPNLIDLSKLEYDIEDNSNHSFRFTANNQYIVFVTINELVSIKDGNNFENIGDFKVTKINNLYYYITSTPKTCTKFKYTFIAIEED